MRRPRGEPGVVATTPGGRAAIAIRLFAHRPRVTDAVLDVTDLRCAFLRAAQLAKAREPGR